MLLVLLIFGHKKSAAKKQFFFFAVCSVCKLSLQQSCWLMFFFFCFVDRTQNIAVEMKKIDNGTDVMGTVICTADF